jgi:hypothetical protein
MPNTAQPAALAEILLAIEKDGCHPGKIRCPYKPAVLITAIQPWGQPLTLVGECGHCSPHACPFAVRGLRLDPSQVPSQGQPPVFCDVLEVT